LVVSVLSAPPIGANADSLSTLELPLALLRLIAPQRTDPLARPRIDRETDRACRLAERRLEAGEATDAAREVYRTLGKLSARRREAQLALEARARADRQEFVALRPAVEVAERALGRLPRGERDELVRQAWRAAGVPCRAALNARPPLAVRLAYHRALVELAARAAQGGAA
jgi:hypothetical protein